MLKAIEEQEAEKTKYQKELIARTKSLDGLQSQIDTLQLTFEDNCWEIQKDIGANMPLAITGTRSNKKLFAQKCLESYTVSESKYDELIAKFDKIRTGNDDEKQRIENAKTFLRRAQSENPEIEVSATSKFISFISDLANRISSGSL